eukprot:3569197-Prymnesium_polylepis.1
MAYLYSSLLLLVTGPGVRCSVRIRVVSRPLALRGDPPLSQSTSPIQLPVWSRNVSPAAHSATRPLGDARARAEQPARVLHQRAARPRLVLHQRAARPRRASLARPSAGRRRSSATHTRPVVERGARRVDDVARVEPVAPLGVRRPRVHHDPVAKLQHAREQRVQRRVGLAPAAPAHPVVLDERHAAPAHERVGEGRAVRAHHERGACERLQLRRQRLVA